MITPRTACGLLAGEVPGEDAARAPADEADRSAVAPVERIEAVTDPVEDRTGRPDVGPQPPAVRPVAPAADERPQGDRRAVVAHEAGQDEHRVPVTAPEPTQPRGGRDERAELERDALLEHPGPHRRRAQRAPVDVLPRAERRPWFGRDHADAATFALLDVDRRRRVAVVVRRGFGVAAAARSSNDVWRQSA